MSSSNAQLIPLCVPTWDEKEVFELGGEYSKELGFFIPASHQFPDDFHQWLPRRFDDTKNPPYLIPEMLPVTSWEDNLRTRLTESHWDRLRRYCYRAAGGRCEICGKHNTPIECHEEWKFDDISHTQKLKRLIALCTLCHKAHHLGFAKRAGIYSEVLEHIMWVNDWTREELYHALDKAQELCNERSAFPWTLDISWVFSPEGYRYV